jgi:anti-sigma regulatory factor (Ser/Thr protein kinase)
LRELSLHILDIAENSVSAGSSRVEVSVIENLLNDRLSIIIRDNGKGMNAETVKHVLDPFVTSRTTRKVGLGLPLLKAAAEGCNGDLTIESKPGVGTTIQVTFQHSHIDRMPLGDLAETWLTLLIGSPEVNWVFHYQVNDEIFFMDDLELKKELAGISFTEPSVMRIIRKLIRDGVDSVSQKAKEQTCLP